MAGELFIIEERVKDQDAEGFALAEVTAFTLEMRQSGNVGQVKLLTLTTRAGRRSFHGAEADRLYKELAKLAIVV